MARPVTLVGVSSTLARVPIRRNLEGSLRVGLAGTGSAEAASATSPYRRLRPEAWWLTRPAAVTHSEAFTPQRAAAAATSISRAAAPARRSGIHAPFRTLELPTVIIRP